LHAVTEQSRDVPVMRGNRRADFAAICHLTAPRGAPLQLLI